MTATTFGHFREPKTPGLGGLGRLGTYIMLGAAAVGIAIAIIVDIRPALIYAVIVAPLLGAVAWKDHHGDSKLEKAGVRVAHWNSVRTGSAEYRSGPLTKLGDYRLPGVLAQTEQSEWVDSAGNPFSLVHAPVPDHYAVCIECYPDGSSLVDDDTAKTHLDKWGEYLAAFAYEPTLIQGMVVIGTSPDDGQVLRDEIQGAADPNAPKIATKIMGEILDAYPAGSADVAHTVTLTFDGQGREPNEMGSALAHRLPELVSRLAATGAGESNLVDADTLARMTRVAYEPAAARFYRQRSDVPTVTRWDSVGPVYASNRDRTHYRHGDAVSVSWSMTGILGTIHSRGLAPLVRPHAGVQNKRVALIYTPHPPAESQKIASQDVNAAQFRIDASRKPSAANRKDLKSAEITADEEAHGHGLVDIAVIVTCTVQNPGQIPGVVAVVDSIAPPLQLRREDGGHAAAFAASLPGIGLVTSAHSMVPKALRESL